MLRLRQNISLIFFKKKAVLLSFLLALFSFLGYAQVTTHIDTTIIRIGEEIKYTIEVEADSTDLVLFPEGPSFRPLEVIDSYKVDTTFSERKMRLVKKYGITQYDSGRYKLPSQRVVIGDKGYLTDSAYVEVRDVPIDTTKQKMFDIKPAIEVNRPPFNWIKLMYWLLPLLVLGLVIWLLFRRKKRRLEREKELPPYEEAMLALQELDGAEFLKSNKSKAYYSSLTEIVKRYIGREVDNTALESTSDELIARLTLHKQAGNFDFDTDTIKKLGAIFKRADLVKFAKMTEEMGQAKADRSVIEDVINETKEAIPEPTEEELRENEAYLEKLAKRRKRRNWILSISGVFVLIAIAMVVYGSVYGFYELRDKVVGNEMRDLVEGRWYESEYGYPSMQLTTPDVLTRIETEFDKEETEEGIILPPPTALDSVRQDLFQYKTKDLGVFIELRQLLTPQSIAIPADQALESGMNRADSLGFQVSLVKNEKFTTANKAEGLKTHGTGVYKDGKEETSMEYAILTFTSEIESPSNPEVKENVMQQLLLFWNEEEVYSKQIAERILNSVELVSEKQESNQEEKEEE